VTAPEPPPTTQAAPDRAPAAPGRTGLTVLAGPSGVGKTSVAAALHRAHPDVWVSVSVTTRPPRPGERDGTDYRFVSPETFAEMVGRGDLLEHASHFGHSYGTPKEPVLDRLAAGVPVLLEIDVAGARQVRAALPGSLLVFLAPPSWQELERRLTGRGTDDPDATRRRLEKARAELAAEDEFDAVIVNHDVGAAAGRLVALMAI
jgi:guanylate kinase